MAGKDPPWTWRAKGKPKKKRVRTPNIDLPEEDRPKTTHPSGAPRPPRVQRTGGKTIFRTNTEVLQKTVPKKKVSEVIPGSVGLYGEAIPKKKKKKKKKKK